MTHERDLWGKKKLNPIKKKSLSWIDINLTELRQCSITKENNILLFNENAIRMHSAYINCWIYLKEMAKKNYCAPLVTWVYFIQFISNISGLLKIVAFNIFLFENFH